MLETLIKNFTSGIEEGLVVMVVGVGVVFLFLAILVVAIYIMSAIVAKINKIFPEKVLEAAPKKKALTGGLDEIAVAIAAVINKR